MTSATAFHQLRLSVSFRQGYSSRSSVYICIIARKVLFVKRGKAKKEAHAPLFCMTLLSFPNEKADASHIESVTENVNPYCAKYTPP